MTLSCTCLAEDFEDVLAIVMDVARRPTFPEAELVKRRAEAITALRQDEDNPAVRAVEALSELLYGAGHPYGRRAKGTVETLERIDRAAIGRVPRALRPPGGLVAGHRRRRRAGAGDRRAPRTRSRVDRRARAPIVVPPPRVPRSAGSVRDDPDAGQGADRHRVRVHDHQPARSRATTRTG